MVEEKIIKIIKPLLYLTALLVVAFSFIIGFPSDIFVFLKYIGYCSIIDAVVFFLYYNFLWRYIPWNRPPILKKKYLGTLYYNYNNQIGQKDISILIEQTWLSTTIKAKTDINSSISICSNIIKDHDEYVLYYTYITAPLTSVVDTNPIQYGSCRLVINEEEETLKGNYWTSRGTRGDISLI